MTAAHGLRQMAHGHDSRDFGKILKKIYVSTVT
jgi:hypothetical protein